MEESLGTIEEELEHLDLSTGVQLENTSRKIIAKTITNSITNSISSIFL